MDYQTEISQSNLERELTSEQTLRELAPFSLAERCELIKDSLGIKISKDILRSVYRKEGVKWKKLRVRRMNS